MARGVVNRSRRLAADQCGTCGGYIEGGHERDGTQLCWCPEPEAPLPELPRRGPPPRSIARDVAETLKYERKE